MKSSARPTRACGHGGTSGWRRDTAAVIAERPRTGASTSAVAVQILLPLLIYAVVVAARAVRARRRHGTGSASDAQPPRWTRTTTGRLTKV